MRIKKTTAGLLVLIMTLSGLSVMPMTALAKDASITSQTLLEGYALSGDWVYYKLSDSEAAIVRYDGAEENVVIPSKIDEYTVTAIDGCSEIYEAENHLGVWTGAFESSSIKSVSIPDNVKRIGKFAFFDCEKLTKVTIPDSVSEIGEKAFGYAMTGKVSGFNIDCNYGSTAYDYAVKNGIDYTLIDKSDLTKCSVTLSTNTYRYAGKQCRPVVTVKDGDKVLELTKDYSYTYNDNNAIGTAYVEITGKGEYAGILTKTYQILPADVKGMKAVSTSANAVKLTWNKVAAADGYVVYIYNKTTKKWQRCAKTTGGINTQLVNKLNSGEAYAFTARAYKIVDGKEVLSTGFTNFKTSTNPDKVSFSVSSYKKGKVAVKWNRVTGATSYAVYYKPTAGAKWQLKAHVSGRIAKCTVGGIRSGNGYVTVRAYKTFEGVTHAGAYEAKGCKVK